jgi:hypothetical protein
MQYRFDSKMPPRIKSHILHFTALGKYFDSLIHNIIFSRIELTTSLDVYSKALKILQTTFERLSDLAREFLAARFFIEDTVS